VFWFNTAVAGGNNTFVLCIDQGNAQIDTVYVASMGLQAVELFAQRGLREK
jgi:hypothetical protein